MKKGIPTIEVTTPIGKPIGGYTRRPMISQITKKPPPNKTTKITLNALFEPNTERIK